MVRSSVAAGSSVVAALVVGVGGRASVPFFNASFCVKSLCRIRIRVGSLRRNASQCLRQFSHGAVLVDFVHGSSLRTAWVDAHTGRRTCSCSEPVIFPRGPIHFMEDACVLYADIERSI